MLQDILIEGIQASTLQGLRGVRFAVGTGLRVDTQTDISLLQAVRLIRVLGRVQGGHMNLYGSMQCAVAFCSEVTSGLAELS